MEKYLVKHIYEQDFGCEGMSEDAPKLWDVVAETLDINREEKTFSVEDSRLTHQKISEGSVVAFTSNNDMVKTGAIFNLMQLISKHFHSSRIQYYQLRIAQLLPGMLHHTRIPAGHIYLLLTCS